MKKYQKKFIKDMKQILNKRVNLVDGLEQARHDKLLKEMYLTLASIEIEWNLWGGSSPIINRQTIADTPPDKRTIW